MLRIPELSLVVLIGASGSGKSTFARRHFKPTEVISSDFCRALVSDDENDMAATNAAFDVLHFIAGKRLEAGKLTVVDATNVQAEYRKPLVHLAGKFHCVPVAIVLDVPEKLCQQRNSTRTDRTIPAGAIHRQALDLRRSAGGLEREGFRYVYLMRSAEEIDAATVERERPWTDLRHEHGPFDIIGDVHGCIDELTALLERLGYEIGDETTPADDQPEAGTAIHAAAGARHPDGRRAIFLGDLVDRGPDSPAVLRLVMDMVGAGSALCVPGNHDMKLLRKLGGRAVQVTHGLAETLAQLEQQPAEFVERVRAFLDGLVSHYVFDDGRLVVAHAGMKPEMQGRASRRVRDFALYGETTGETDDLGLPVRYNWAQDYRGAGMVVYGHTPVREAEWLNRTINLDTGCVFGGSLTALRYPERELVSVPAERAYYEPARPLSAEPDALASAAREAYDLIDIDDVLGKRLIRTRWLATVAIDEAHAAAALEVMSRFAIDPRWLIYLPPTMSPTETSQEPGLLEHPSEAFRYFREQGVATVVCEEKHMGSRAIAVVARDANAAYARFRVASGEFGSCFTRTGRPFFSDPALGRAVIERIRAAADGAGLWDELGTSWLCLDCEITPWSFKAESLLRDQYAPVGAAAGAALTDAMTGLEQAGARLPEVRPLLERYRTRLDAARRYVAAYRRYCWTVNGINDLRVAPFHLLASEGAVHADKTHAWHLAMIQRLSAADAPHPSGIPLLVPTAAHTVDLADESSEAQAVKWWTELTAAGSEGMVVKPDVFAARSARGLMQPALKCRGPEYLRIIYGPEYDMPEHLARLRHRGLGRKRSLALREFSLGLEALSRFVEGDPLYRVHECVFGVLALESEPVDPRL